MNEKYFGGLDLRLENGNIVHMSTNSGHKIDSLSESDLAELPSDVQDIVKRLKNI